MPSTASTAATKSKAAASTSSRPLSLRDLAKNALADADGNVALATSAVAEMLLGNPSILNGVIKELVEEASASFVGQVHRYQRSVTILSTRSPEAGRRAAFAFASGVGATLMDFPLADGTRLRDATGEQVAEMAQRYAKTRDDASKKSAWLSAIAARVNPKQRVSDALSLNDVTKLFEEA